MAPPNPNEFTLARLKLDGEIFGHLRDVLDALTRDPSQSMFGLGDTNSGVPGMMPFSTAIIALIRPDRPAAASDYEIPKVRMEFFTWTLVQTMMGDMEEGMNESELDERGQYCSSRSR